MGHQRKLTAFRSYAGPTGPRRCWNCSEAVPLVDDECENCGEELGDG